MLPHPTMVLTVSDLRRQEWLTTVERERQAVAAATPAPQWHSFAIRALALVSLVVGPHR